LEVRTDQLSLDESINFVLKRMTDDGIIESNNKPRVVESHIEENVTDEERKEFEALKSIDIDREQVEYL
jgi:hypothetical protein